MLLPVWLSGIDDHAIMIAAFAAMGSQLLNNVFAAHISGREYTATYDKIVSGTVAAIVATFVIILIMLIVYQVHNNMGINSGYEVPGYTVSL